MTVVSAHFTLVERAGAASGRLDVVVALADRQVHIAGIAVDLIAAARNDERAFVYPLDTRDTIGPDALANITTLLVPHVRLLTRRRVMPLKHVFAFATEPR